MTLGKWFGSTARQIGQMCEFRQRTPLSSSFSLLPRFYPFPQRHTNQNRTSHRSTPQGWRCDRAGKNLCGAARPPPDTDRKRGDGKKRTQGKLLQAFHRCVVSLRRLCTQTAGMPGATKPAYTEEVGRGRLAITEASLPRNFTKNVAEGNRQKLLITIKKLEVSGLIRKNAYIEYYYYS